ncbi:RNA polymerase II transcription factor B subunit 4 [Loxospora ochrophaea]|nr:RNA polymerase II transcription factor B subunit 4 [Loxospora ochrophaea]
MNAVDGSEHYEKNTDEAPPSLLAIIIDTNPNAWALLAETLPLSKAIANLLVFINAHLAFNYANKVAIIASHIQRAEFLYPPSSSSAAAPKPPIATNGSADIDMQDSLPTSSSVNGTHHPNGNHPADDANKYRPFRLIEETLLTSLRALISTTTPSTLSSTPTTSIAGALTLALTYINKQATISPLSTNPLNSRILILSVSGDLAHQYIPIMNCIFASQRLNIPVDIAKIAGDTVFLQQASDATHGTYIKLEHPQGLLQYLMMGFLPDQTHRRSLISPTQVGVDFRAACFCHRRVVDVGFVCSICLSIFCSPPEDGACFTCGTHLRLGDYGGKPAVMPRKKKKRKNRVDGGIGGTPAPS